MEEGGTCPCIMHVLSNLEIDKAFRKCIVQAAFPYINRNQGVDIQEVLTQCKSTNGTETGSTPQMFQF